MTRIGALLCEAHLRQREADLSARAATAAPREGVSALLRLVAAARQPTGQGHRLRRFLLGLYNGPEWPFDLTDLRNLDRDLQQDALAVLQLDWHGGHEVHNYIEDGDRLFLRWWEEGRPETDPPA